MWPSQVQPVDNSIDSRSVLSLTGWFAKNVVCTIDPIGFLILLSVVPKAYEKVDVQQLSLKIGQTQSTSEITPAWFQWTRDSPNPKNYN